LVRQQQKKKNEELSVEALIQENFKVYPLMIAAAKGEDDMVKTMLRNKSLNINIQDDVSGITPIWLACLYKHGSIVRILANAGAEIHVTNKNNINLLHLAIFNNDINIVEMLIKSNFPLDDMTDQGMTPLHLSARLGHTEISQTICNAITES